MMAGYQALDGIKMSPNRKLSKEKANKPPQSVKNNTIHSKKSETMKKNTNGTAIPYKGLPLSNQSSDQTPMSFGVVRSQPITKHHSRHGSLAKTNTSTSLYGASLNFN